MDPGEGVRHSASRRFAEQESIAQGVAQRVIDLVVEVLDVNALIARIDLNVVLARVELNSLLHRADLNEVRDQVDLNQVLDRWIWISSWPGSTSTRSLAASISGRW
jgi:hypothetical protein